VQTATNQSFFSFNALKKKSAFLHIKKGRGKRVIQEETWGNPVVIGRNAPDISRDCFHRISRRHLS